MKNILIEQVNEALELLKVIDDFKLTEYKRIEKQRGTILGVVLPLLERIKTYPEYSELCDDSINHVNQISINGLWYTENSMMMKLLEITHSVLVPNLITLRNQIIFDLKKEDKK